MEVSNETGVGRMFTTAISAEPKRWKVRVHLGKPTRCWRFAQKVAPWLNVTVDGPLRLLVPADVERAQLREELKLAVGQMVVYPVRQ